MSSKTTFRAFACASAMTRLPRQVAILLNQKSKRKNTKKAPGALADFVSLHVYPEPSRSLAALGLDGKGAERLVWLKRHFLALLAAQGTKETDAFVPAVNQEGHAKGRILDLERAVLLCDRGIRMFEDHTITPHPAVYVARKRER